MSNLRSIALKTIDGQDASLADYAGRVLLVVNTASKCGLTPQYEGLEALHNCFREQGFTVLGFPCNDFKGQEPGSEEEIKSFCTTNYNVSFPLFSKITIVGDGKHPLYAGLIKAQPKAEASEGFREKLANYGIATNPEPEVLWNFEKFLINGKGEVVARFAPDMAPQDERIVSAIERELAAA